MGSGLGLWIGQEIMKKHGSVIRFRSEGAGKGSTFFFVLPVYEILHTQNQPPSPSFKLERLPSRQLRTPSTPPKSFLKQPRIAPEYVEAKSDKITFDAVPQPLEPRKVLISSLKVLVADDSPLNLKYLKRHIQHSVKENSELFAEDLNLEIVQANDGTVALDHMRVAQLSGRPFNVVFMDNIMSTMHGTEAAQLMRQEGFTGLIIGVTGNVLEVDVKEYLKAGADRVLPKPVDSKAITEVLQKLHQPWNHYEI